MDRLLQTPTWWVMNGGNLPEPAARQDGAPRQRPVGGRVTSGDRPELAGLLGRSLV